MAAQNVKSFQERIQEKFGEETPRKIGGKFRSKNIKTKKKEPQTNPKNDRITNKCIRDINGRSVYDIDEVNLFKDDGSVVHIKNPRVDMVSSGNVYVISRGKTQNTRIEALMPSILQHLGPENIEYLSNFACVDDDEIACLEEELNKEVPLLPNRVEIIDIICADESLTITVSNNKISEDLPINSIECKIMALNNENIKNDLIQTYDLENKKYFISNNENNEMKEMEFEENFSENQNITYELTLDDKSNGIITLHISNGLKYNTMYYLQLQAFNKFGGSPLVHTWCLTNKPNLIFSVAHECMELTDDNMVKTPDNIPSTCSSYRARTNIGFTVGIFYWEILWIKGGGTHDCVGVSVDNMDMTSLQQKYYLGTGGGYCYNGGQQIYDAYTNKNGTNYGESFNANDRIGVLLNLNERTIEFYKNSKSLGVAFTNIQGTVFYPAIQICHNGEQIQGFFDVPVPPHSPVSM
jgi:hypothetical protein